MVLFFILRKVGVTLLVTNKDILNTIGIKIKQARLAKKYTQDFVSEQIDISTDLLRNIENGRNVGSLPTLLNLCNFLELSPNYLFAELLTFKEDTLDSKLQDLSKKLDKESKAILKEIIIHIDGNY